MGLWEFAVPYSNDIILKTKKFHSVFSSISEIFSKFLTSSKKKVLIANVLPILKTVKDLVRPLSQKRLFRSSFDSQYVKVSQTLVKPAWEHFHHIFSSSEGKEFEKILPYWNLKSSRCLLTHWLPIKSILFRIARICSSLFKCNYIKNQKSFLNILFNWWNLYQTLNIFK